MSCRTVSKPFHIRHPENPRGTIVPVHSNTHIRISGANSYKILNPFSRLSAPCLGNVCLAQQLERLSDGRALIVINCKSNTRNQWSFLLWPGVPLKRLTLHTFLRNQRRFHLICDTLPHPDSTCLWLLRLMHSHRNLDRLKKCISSQWPRI